MSCSYDDLCYNMCTVLRGNYCVIQHSGCNTNTTIIIVIIIIIFCTLGSIDPTPCGFQGLE